MVGHGHEIPLELVGTMIEMADVAWNAIEHRTERKVVAKEEEIAHLLSENQHLKTLLFENLSLLQGLSQAPSLVNNCPPDLHTRLLAVVDTANFLATLESLAQKSGQNEDLLCTKENDLHYILNNVKDENHNQWVIVKRDKAPDDVEETSAIDNEDYIIINEENVVNGIAEFVSRGILENPKSRLISPQELQKAVAKALDDLKGRAKLKNMWEAGKFIYALSTWGIFIAGLYRHQAVVKVAAKGVYSSTKFVLKAL